MVHVKDFDVSESHKPIRDFDVLKSSTPGFSINEKDRLLLAKQTLLGFAVISSCVFIAYSCFPTNLAIKEIFEVVKIGILPLVVLVISFYFPSNNR